ncbi:MAG: hypothetical protein AAGA92_08080 [Planctomycetota bacterium]
MPHRVRKTPENLRSALLLGVCWALTATGCYDAESLVQSHRATAMLTKLEEVDLGEFRVTLPYARGEASTAEIRFHAFGQVTYKDLKTVQKAIDAHDSEIMHGLLLSVRQLPIADLEDPRLVTLRQQIQDVVNNRVEGEPLKMVGFYDFKVAIN